MTSKLVAVSVMLHNREWLTDDERISLRHLERYLGHYDRYCVAPRGLRVNLPGFGVKRFSGKFFGSAAANGRLVLSRRFYRAFAEYEYVLIYHLDALVLSDQLAEWCRSGLDYIGAPWVNCPDSPWVNRPRIGNGGFSLRRIESFLQVIDSPRYWMDPEEYWRQYSAGKPPLTRALNVWRKYAKRLRWFNSARREMARWDRYAGDESNEDFFWSDAAIRYYPEFKIASFAEGLRFAFEVCPRLCFELNGRELPFGCHAWPKYDRAFWEPHLLR
jgi:hypothetical protein